MWFSNLAEQLCELKRRAAMRADILARMQRLMLSVFFGDITLEAARDWLQDAQASCLIWQMA